MRPFFETVNHISPLSAESEEKLAAVMQYHEFEKGYILVKPGPVCLGQMAGHLIVPQ